MKVETFFEKFDEVADAPNVVAKMRELVLQLAVHGKLVEQRSGEGDVDSLLKAIVAARKKVGLAKSSDEAETEELPEIEGWHQVPPSWRWVQLKAIGDIVGGGTPRSDNPAYFADEGIPWLTPADLNGFKAKRIFRGRRCITKAGLEDSSARLLPAGSVLFSSRAPIGYVAIAGTDLATNQGFKSCVPFVRETNEFLYYYLMSAAARIDREASGTTFREVSGKIVNQIPVPLPPLAEQKRIVAKVDELMALCDRLEEQQQERETRHAPLARASLARFADAPTPANLDFLFHKSYTIIPADVRKAILSLAIQGKLIPQDPNDEPASNLLMQIDIEKRQLVSAGKIRKQDEAASISEDEVPFNVPAGWQWARLSVITRRIHYGYTASAKSEIRNVRLLRITDIQNNTVDWPSVPGCEIAEEDISQYQLERGDILVARTGGTVGKTYLVRDVPVIAVFASYLIRIQGASALFDRYLKLFLESPTYWVQLEEGARGGAQPNVNAQTLGRMIVTIPPLAEQRRIVAKVDQLMTLVDQLETQLTASRATAEKLMEAVVAELTTQD